MNTLNLLTKDFVETGITAGVGAVGSRYLFGESVIGTDLPILNYLNGYDSLWLYFAIFGGSTALSNITGDFVLPLISGKPYFSYLNKLSKPISIGLLGVGIAMALDGFSSDYMFYLNAFLLGAGSNIAGQWISEMIAPKNIYSQFSGMNLPSVPSSHVSAPIDVPFNVNDYFGLMAF